MKIKYLQGNLLDVDSGVIAHGCNAQGVMGSGVAKFVRDKYPEAYKKYNQFCVDTDDNILGSIVWYAPKSDLYIANCITQEYFGAGPSRYVSYDAIDVSFALINDKLKVLPKKTLHIPKIGAGLGGGNWDIISSIIENNITEADEVICWIL